IVAHSLGCLLWFHNAMVGSDLAPPNRVLLVAPPNQALLDHPDLKAFLAAGFETSPAAAGRVKGASRSPTRLICSDNDHYCPEGAVSAYGRPLGLDVDLLSGQAHLDLDAGY